MRVCNMLSQRVGDRGTERSVNTVVSTIDRLFKSYQKSSWKDDARTLLAQIPGGSSGAGSGTGTGAGAAGGTESAADRYAEAAQAAAA